MACRHGAAPCGFVRGPFGLLAVAEHVVKGFLHRESHFTAIVFCAALLLLVELVALVIGVSLTRTITRAVHHLYDGTERVKEGDFSHRVAVSGTDQLASLTRSFNSMTENLERLVKVAKEKERIQADLEIAMEVQSQLYPRSVPSVEGLRITALRQPARMVSGDYYDYPQLAEDKLAIAIGDVAGKGISAALLMATLQSSVRAQIRSCLELARATPGNGHGHHILPTSDLVAKLNQQLHADTAPEKYATVFFSVYDAATSVLTYTNAGHLAPILVRNGTASRLGLDGMVVGLFPKAVYGESRLEFEPGDLLVMFTDGVSEPENEYEEMFGEERLIDLVTRNAHLPEEEIGQLVKEAVEHWTGSSEWQDDFTMLLVRRTQP
ncbi:MAG: HAMP domain-containing protein [Acidobacteria bacterium]|nr:HAMP domain-containing protein [Acidobacteriota bacterium]